MDGRTAPGSNQLFVLSVVKQEKERKERDDGRKNSSWF